MTPTVLPRPDWRALYPGSEAAIAEQGIDPDRVVNVADVTGYRTVGRIHEPGVGFVDVDVLYRELRVDHAEPLPFLPGSFRRVQTVIPWAGWHAPTTHRFARVLDRIRPHRPYARR